MTLLHFLKRCQMGSIIAAYALGRIDPGNDMAIHTLVRLLDTTQNEYIRSYAAYSLERIAPGNDMAFQALVGLLDTVQDEYRRGQVVSRLMNHIKRTDQQYATLVALLRRNLQDQCSFEVILKCADKLPYLDFYRAFNSPIKKG